MKRASNVFLVLITAPNLPTARRLTRALLQDRVAACVNIVPTLESHYWWQGKLDRSREVLLVVKSTGPKLRALEKKVLALHPYDTPEILALPVRAGTPRYLRWLAETMQPPARSNV